MPHFILMAQFCQNLCVCTLSEESCLIFPFLISIENISFEIKNILPSNFYDVDCVSIDIINLLSIG